MQGYLSIILHAHLPFVRHSEQERFLEESWFYEAVHETYLPLILLLRRWDADGLRPHLTLTVSPTLSAMLRDPLLQQRCQRRLDSLIEFSQKECIRNLWQPDAKAVAEMYLDRMRGFRSLYDECQGDIAGALARLQKPGLLEIIPCAATHAVLPLLAGHPPSIRAQIHTARDAHIQAFGHRPSGFWLPECAYSPEVEPALKEAGFLWTVLESHGILNPATRPRHGLAAPVMTAGGLAVFGRDSRAARQVWSRQEGYPGDRRYRDFYRDAGYDLDFDYVQPYLPAPRHRGFTGLKFHAITGREGEKQIYRRKEALEAVREHADHFIQERMAQFRTQACAMDRPPLIVCPYDAELFGHWWFEGLEFLDAVVRAAANPAHGIGMIHPTEYLRRHPDLQKANPMVSSWGEGGGFQVWQNKDTAWIHDQLRPAQLRMTAMAVRQAAGACLDERALRLAGNELLLAQASDWPFMLKNGSHVPYATRRIQQHLACFHDIASQMESGLIDLQRLAELESRDLVFPDLDWRCWLMV